jgi:hypothetical protein
MIKTIASYYISIRSSIIDLAPPPPQAADRKKEEKNTLLCVQSDYLLFNNHATIKQQFLLEEEYRIQNTTEQTKCFSFSFDSSIARKAELIG